MSISMMNISTSHKKNPAEFNNYNSVMNLIFKCVHDVTQIQTMFSSRYSPPRPYFNIRAAITCSAYFSVAHWRGGSAKKGERPCSSGTQCTV